MFWRRKKAIPFVCLVSLLTMCSTNKGVSNQDFLTSLEKLPYISYKYAYVDGSFVYVTNKTYIEKASSKSDKKEEIISGKYEIIDKYTISACDDSSLDYKDYLFTARSVFGSDFITRLIGEDGYYGNINEMYFLRDFLTQKNRTLKLEPLAIEYAFKGHSHTIVHLHHGKNSPAGYYDIKGHFDFDDFGYPREIQINCEYLGYRYQKNDEQSLIARSLRYSVKSTYALHVNINWEE